MWSTHYRHGHQPKSKLGIQVPFQFYLPKTFHWCALVLYGTWHQRLLEHKMSEINYTDKVWFKLWQWRILQQLPATDIQASRRMIPWTPTMASNSTYDMKFMVPVHRRYITETTLTHFSTTTNLKGLCITRKFVRERVQSKQTISLLKVGALSKQ